MPDTELVMVPTLTVPEPGMEAMEVLEVMEAMEVSEAMEVMVAMVPELGIEVMEVIYVCLFVRFGGNICISLNK